MIKESWLLSDYVYGDLESVPPINGYFLLKTIRKENDYCEVWQYRDKLFIVFRGSDEWKDWVSNIKKGFFKNQHEDFLYCALKFLEELQDIIKSNLNLEIICTGHSRGAALATFIAEKLSIIKSISCITFGTPPVGDKSYRDFYNKLPIDHTNVYVGYDIIHINTLAHALGLRNVGKEYQIKKPWYWVIIYYKVVAHLKETLRDSINKLQKTSI